MAEKNYRFEIDGVGGGDKPWHTSGHITCEFSQTLNEAMKASFDLLTEGKAEYGKPGPCGGPYKIKKFIIVEE